MAVTNIMVIYHGNSTLETTGIFITLAVNFHGIWTLEIVGFLPRWFTQVNYLGMLITLASGFSVLKLFSFETY